MKKGMEMRISVGLCVLIAYLTALSCQPIHAELEWSAYNDCIGSVYANTTSITNYEGYSGPTSGRLINYNTGSTSGMPIVSVQIPAGYEPKAAFNYGVNPIANTPAYQIFNGKINFSGTIIQHCADYCDSGSCWYQSITFSDLDPDKRYTFVGSAFRNAVYPDRIADHYLLGADDFVNNSSPGIYYMQGNLTKLIAGGNATTGYVVRWDEIDPGDDGSFTIYTVPDPASGSNGRYGYPLAGFLLEEHDIVYHNNPPQVYVVDDITTNLFRGQATLTINANVTDDPLDESFVPALNWEQLDGPADVYFANGANNAELTAIFPTQGQYTLSLTATDDIGQQASDIVVIDVLLFNTVDCPHGDINNDCAIDIEDMVHLASCWLNSQSDPADINADAHVDIADFSHIAQNWQVIPETSVYISEFDAINSHIPFINNLDIYTRYPWANTSINNANPDWIELYNGSFESIDLSNWYLTDDPANLVKWQFPADQGEYLVLDPGEFIIVFASGRVQSEFPDNYPFVDAFGSLHTNFSISSDGGYLALVKPDGTTVCHSYENYPPQYPFTTYGISRDGSIGYLKEPTAGTMVNNKWSGMVNSVAYQGITPPVIFNKSHGYYDETFSVELTCSDSQAQIKYTTDGSDPRIAGTVYAGPLTINTTTCLRAAALRNDYLTPNITTASYIFPENVVLQTRPSDSRYTLEWGEDSIGDFDMENDATHIKLVAGNTSYTEEEARSIIKNALLALPALSIATAPENLFDSSIGIYNHSRESGIEWERPASAELFDSMTNEQFHIDCGLRVQGGASREPLKSPKHSLSLRFNGGYGNSALEHKLFDRTDNTTFNSIQLRACFNNSWIHSEAVQRSRGMLIRDQFIRECLLDMGNPDAGAGRYVHLYINGLYWGIYMLHERAEASHYAAYFGGEPEYYDALNGGEVNDGTYSKWQDLGSLLQSAVGSNQSTWENIAERIDINNYIDWTIIQRYGGNEDLKTDGNWKVAGGGLFNAPWRYYAWDSERTMEKSTAFADTQLKTWPFLDTYLTRFTEFKVQFADRLYKHLQGPLSTAATQARWLKFKDMLDTAIVAESARWGDYRRATPYTRHNEWLAENTRVLGYISSLTSNIIVHFQSLGWYPNIVPPTLNVNAQASSGGIITNNDTLTINNPNGFGTIYYSTDQTDPRQYWTGSAIGNIYSGQILLNRNTTLMARILSGSTWSALQQATFQIGDAMSGLRISELMYHPSDGGVEFIELTNIGSEPINLYQLYFDQGITFTFPDITINSGEYVVITDNITLFTQTYPDFTGILAGEFTGSLSNSGETITLKNISNHIIQQFTYTDSWYKITDGDGFSLTIIDTLQTVESWNYPANWRPGNTLGGSPGFDDTGDIPATRSIIINELLAHSHAEAADWIELYNTTETPINLGGWLLSDSSSDLAKYEIPTGTIIEPFSYLVLYQDQTFGNNDAPGCNSAFALSENGETLYLSSAQNGSLTGYYQHEEFGASLTGESFGRYILSDGQYDFVTLSYITPGSANATAKIGPLVISEIMYAPLQTAGDNYDKEEYEYIRISNITTTDITLSEMVEEAGRNVSWKISDGIEYTFPVGTIIPAGQSVIIARNPDAFIQKYSAGSAELLGPYSGKLNNSGEIISLTRPGEYENTIQYYTIVDSIEYSDESPWPSAADGTGPALKRINNSAYGNDHSNWQAQLPL